MEFYMHKYLPFLPVALHIALVTAFRSFTNLKPHPSQMRLVRLIVHSEEQKDMEEILSHCLQPSRIKFQHAATTLCVCHGRSLSTGPILQCQASHGSGKSGLIETGLTGLVATALLYD